MAFAARPALLADPALSGAPLCRALAHATDSWLRGVFDESGASALGPVSLVAVGGYGRGELAPSSDLDVLLLHDTKRGIEKVAEQIWYPVWDARLKLGHSVRTVKEALRLAAEDLDTATSLLDIRHVAGDAALTRKLADDARAQWRKRSKGWLTELSRRVDQQHARYGEVAFLLEPNLKEGRGGLRDVHALRWAQAAEMVLLAGDQDSLDRAYDVLLGARVELHRITGRPGDVLLLQDQDPVAERLGLPDADELMARVSAAARTIAWTSDEAWLRVKATIEGPPGKAARRDRPLASGVVLRDGEVHLDVQASPRTDPTLVLRVAAAAAHHHTRIERQTLDRLADEAPAFGEHWPAGASDDLAALLLAGPPAIPVLEALDQRQLLVRILPEWANVQCKPQRNAYHTFTVDRHLWQTAANAAGLADRVRRPDLLVLGALFHDLGKGWPGDHTDNGIDLVRQIGPRLGLPPDDVGVLETMVRHHLLLADVATRRDLSDDATIVSVAELVQTHLALDLLAALTEADSLATGPSAWSPWKAELLAELVDKVHHVIGGGAVEEATWSLFPSPEVLARMGSGKTSVVAAEDRVTVVAKDRPGLFARVAGVLSIHGLDVLGAQAHSDELGMAASEFRVAVPEHGVPWERVNRDLQRALDGQLAIEARLAERARTYRHRASLSATKVVPQVSIDNDLSSNATVIEVHAPDQVGILHRIAKALSELSLDIRHARVQTIGHEVVDTFYVRIDSGDKLIDSFHRAEVERALLHAISEG